MSSKDPTYIAWHHDTWSCHCPLSVALMTYTYFKKVPILVETKLIAVLIRFAGHHHNGFKAGYKSV